MIGVLGAMEQEVALVAEGLENRVDTTVGPRWFGSGRLEGHDVVVSVSGFGKVAAASTVTSMIDRFGITALLFSGVAGGVGPGVGIGDLVVADELVQHDFDASPIFPPFVVPSIERSHVPADARLSDALAAAADQVAADPPTSLSEFTMGPPTVHRGIVASGDRFIDDPDEVARLVASLPGLLAVEMEGAAVAQVCTERDLPFGVVRTISDRADAEAPTDFLRFVDRVAAPVGAAVVGAALRRL
jgi:adenosylhomocysteine nucleosidase